MALFHYRDYQEDLAGELQRLGAELGIEIDSRRAGELAAEAALDRMRARAEELAPDTGHNHWLDTRRFFRSGGRGEWSDRFTEELADRYAERVEEFADGDADFVAWLHEGRGGANPSP